MPLPFKKMHGLGNDFVILDTRTNGLTLSVEQRRAIADRRRGVGCDQLIVLEAAQTPDADLFMRIYNPDGSEAGACGNAARCVARILFAETGRSRGVLQTISGLLPVQAQTDGMIEVDFGLPRLDWHEIPLARACDTLHVPLTVEGLSDPCCVNMGNPHAVFFVADVDKIDLPRLGARLESDPMFPERCNIEIAQILSPTQIRMRVFERGAGITQACGSGACATLVAAVRRGLVERCAMIVMDGGDLTITWRAEDDHVLMRGATSLSFEGMLAEGLGVKE
jgi:diaminopimelate epimerase